LSSGGRYEETHINDTKDEPVQRAHSEVASTSVTFNRFAYGRLGEEFVHLGNATDLIRDTIYSEHEDEDDSEQDGSMGAIEPDEVRRKVHRGVLLVG
jgi:hypothetical protein